MERKESFPCLICGMTLYRVNPDNEAQPSDGVMCSTSGNYGSTVFDSFNGEVIRFSICDNCFVQAGDKGRLHMSVERLKIVTDGPSEEWGDTLVGWRDVERPFVTWTTDLEPADDREYLEPAEVAAKIDDDNYHWTLDKPVLLKFLGVGDSALTDLRKAVAAARKAADDDSNDAEIEALQDALEQALALVPGWIKEEE